MSLLMVVKTNMSVQLELWNWSNPGSIHTQYVAQQLLQQALQGMLTSQSGEGHNIFPEQGITWGLPQVPGYQKPQLMGENWWERNCSPPRGCVRAQQEWPGTGNESVAPWTGSWGWQSTRMQFLFTKKWTRYFVTASNWQLGEGGWKGR